MCACISVCVCARAFKVYIRMPVLSLSHSSIHSSIHSFDLCEYEATNHCIQYYTLKYICTHTQLHENVVHTSVRTQKAHTPRESDKRILDKYTCHSTLCVLCAVRLCASISVVGKLKLLNHTLPVIPPFVFISFILLQISFRCIISDFFSFFSTHFTHSFFISF